MKGHQKVPLIARDGWPFLRSPEAWSCMPFPPSLPTVVFMHSMNSLWRTACVCRLLVCKLVHTLSISLKGRNGCWGSPRPFWKRQGARLLLSLLSAAAERTWCCAWQSCCQTMSQTGVIFLKLSSWGLLCWHSLPGKGGDGSPCADSEASCFLQHGKNLQDVQASVLVINPKVRQMLLSFWYHSGHFL